MPNDILEFFRFYRALFLGVFRLFRWLFGHPERVAAIAVAVTLVTWCVHGRLGGFIAPNGIAGSALFIACLALAALFAMVISVRLWRAAHYVAAVLLCPLVWIGASAATLHALDPHAAGGITTLLYSLALMPILYHYRSALIDDEGAAKRQVARILRGFVRRHPGDYRLLTNLRLPHGGKLAPIDHVLITPAGVFVIESRCYPGVYIDPEGAWFSGANRARFLDNPLRQSHTHAQAMQAVLGEELRCASLVVVTAPAKALLGYVPREVLSVKALRAALEEVHQQAPRRFEAAHVRAIAAALEQAHRPQRSARRVHGVRARSRQRETGIRCS